MKLDALLLPELRVEGETTKRVLERVSDASFAWRPHAKSRSLGDLAQHIAYIPSLFLARLEQRECDRSTLERHATNAVDLLEVFDDGMRRGAIAIERLSDAQWMENWRYRHGTTVIFELPRYVVARTTAINHLIHHRGQLTVYLRQLGVAVPSVYGPSADEA